MKEDVGADSEALGIDSHDVAMIRRSRTGQRMLLIAAGAMTAVLSFIAGAVTKDMHTSSYPFAVGSSAPISGAVAASSAFNRRSLTFAFALLALASFVLGVLLTGGGTQTDVYPQGGVPEYGVYGR